MVQTARDKKTKTSLHVVDKEPVQNSILRHSGKRIKPGRVLLLALGSYLLFSFLVGGFEIWKLKKELKRIELEQNQIVQQQNELQKEIESLYNPEVIEKLARENLGMVINGETVVIPAIPGQNLPKPKNVNEIEIGH